MSKHLKYLIEGTRNVLVLDPDVAYVRPSRDSFRSDVKSLRRDSSQVSRDLNKTVRKYGKVDDSQSQK